jgi:glycosyltransferase involved in cell wall biosynthesis
VDAKDQWPQIFVESFPRVLRPFVSLVLLPYFYLARRTFKEADAFCSMSKSFLMWMSSFSGRSLTTKDLVSPLSSPQRPITDQEEREALAWWQSLGVSDDGAFRLLFVGSVSSAFDFTPVVEAARIALEKGLNWQFLICGDGPILEGVRQDVAGLMNVVVSGWIDLPRVHVAASLSSVGLAPYKNTKNFVDNIPNKVIDYLSFGMPIVSPLRGEVKALIDDFGIGKAYNDGVKGDLFRALHALASAPHELMLMSADAAGLYEKHYDGNLVYNDLADRIVQLAEGVR